MEPELEPQPLKMVERTEIVSPAADCSTCFDNWLHSRRARGFAPTVAMCEVTDIRVCWQASSFSVSSLLPAEGTIADGTAFFNAA